MPIHRIFCSGLVGDLRRAALAIACTAAAMGQEPPSLPSVISLEAPPPIVETSFDARGRAEIGLRGITPYGIRLDAGSAGTRTSLLCAADPVALGDRAWSRATGACRIIISANVAAGDPVRIVRLNISRAPYGANGESLPSETSTRDVEIRLMPPRAAVQPPGWSLAAKSAVAGGFVIIILAAIVVFMRSRRSRAPETEDSSDTDAADEPSEVPPPLILTDAPDDIRERIRKLEERLEEDRKTLNERAGSVLGDAVRELSRSATMLIDEARRLQSSVAQRAEELRRYAQEVNQLKDIPPDRLSLLLAAVPETALAMPSSPETARTIAAQFDSAVRTCIREASSAKGGLEPMAKTVSGLWAPLDSLLEAASKLQNPALTHRLAEVRTELREMSDELEAALAGFVNDRGYLSFGLKIRLELSTLDGSEQSLTSELAKSLRKQLFRLTDPVNYFGRRFELTIGQALQEVIDCCDTLLDPGRRMDAIQKQVAAFVSAADATLIEPRPGMPLLDNEHLVFGVVTGGGPGDKPDHISALRVRGIKRRGQVLRKASVTIFG